MSVLILSRYLSAGLYFCCLVDGALVMSLIHDTSSLTAFVIWRLPSHWVENSICPFLPVHVLRYEEKEDARGYDH